MDRPPDLVSLTEYIHNVLYFAVVRPGRTLKNTTEVNYFSIDEKLIYENYYSDFGPLKLSCVYKYCRMLNEKFKVHLNRQRLVHYTSNDPKKKSNAAYLLGCYGVLYLNFTPHDALKPLVANGQTFRNFQDAIQGDSCYTISVLDCLNGIKKAKDLGLFNFQDFNCEEYDRLDKIQGGDLNWIVPGKFLAFIGPVDYNYGVSMYHPPEIYVDYFLENNVLIVIRLNKKFYDGSVFANMGIHHYDLFFPDGSCPPRHILVKFLQISEETTDCSIAVHCKNVESVAVQAGLGRTGSLIGCYLIKHYRMTAHEAIAWMRICRPGSVIGHQQGWLEQLEPWLMKQGNSYRKRQYSDPNKLPFHEYGIYSFVEARNRLQKKSPMMSPTHSRSPSPVCPRSLTPTSLQSAQSSKTKDAQHKTTEADTSARGSMLKFSPDWCVSSRAGRKAAPVSHQSNHTDHQTRPELPRILYKRTTGPGGEPRTTQPQMLPRPSRRVEAPSPSDHQQRRRNSVYTVSALRNPQGVHIAKNIDEAKNTLTRSSYQRMGEQKRSRKSLESSLVVTRAANMSSFVSDNMPAYISNAAAQYQSAIRASAQNRSRLGRSPSPPPSRKVSQRSTTTSTHTLAQAPTPKSSVGTQKPSALQEALSKLQTGITLARERSAGAASMGVASLGARRDAPAPPAPSARSDDRARATQGDLLNSVKFERRLREAQLLAKLERKCSPDSSYAQFADKPSRSSSPALKKESVMSRQNTFVTESSVRASSPRRVYRH